MKMEEQGGCPPGRVGHRPYLDRQGSRTVVDEISEGWLGLAFQIGKGQGPGISQWGRGPGLGR
jgi:hypothetical protein